MSHWTLTLSELHVDMLDIRNIKRDTPLVKTRQLKEPHHHRHLQPKQMRVNLNLCLPQHIK